MVKGGGAGAGAGGGVGGGVGGGALVPPLGTLVPPLDALVPLLTAPAPLLWYAPISGVPPRVFPMRSTEGVSAASPAAIAGLPGCNCKLKFCAALYQAGLTATSIGLACELVAPPRWVPSNCAKLRVVEALCA